MARAAVPGSRPLDEWLRALEAGKISPAEVLRRAVTGAGAVPGGGPGAGNAPPAPARPRGGRPGSGTNAAAAEAAERRQRVEAVLAELDGLVGLTAVKRKVRKAYAFARIQELRRQAGLATAPATLHMAFLGHPGTGKTTVARLVGRLFCAAGLLSRGHLVEVERADLVGEYIGHTALRTRDTLRRAAGGVLFIDEAYSLARGGDRDFGREAIDCLVRGMEEQRADLAVILAGYPAEMEWLLQQNPGLTSRVPTRIYFPDYSAAELLRIAQQMLADREYVLEPPAAALLAGHIVRHCGSLTGCGGNGRAVRNLVERTLACQALRLVAVDAPTRQQLLPITRADVEEALQP